MTSIATIFNLLQLITRIIDFFMKRLNKSLQIFLLYSLIITLITRIRYFLYFDNQYVVSDLILIFNFYQKFYKNTTFLLLELSSPKYSDFSILFFVAMNKIIVIVNNENYPEENFVSHTLFYVLLQQLVSKTHKYLNSP